MQMIYKFLGVLLAASLIPLMMLGFLAYRGMVSIGEHAATASLEALELQEPRRFEEVTTARALQIDRTLALVANDVTHLRERFDEAYAEGRPPPTPPPYSGRDTVGLPGYGYVDPAVDVFADFDHLGPGGIWLPRPSVRLLRADPTLSLTTSRQVYAALALSPDFRDLKKRHGDLLDLAWVVLEHGLSNSYPPYDFRKILRDRPELADLDELREVYVLQVTPEADPDREIRWTDPYLDAFRGAWMTSCVAPLYEGDRFVGSIGMDIQLPTVVDQVVSFHPTEGGYAFLVSSEDHLVALSEEAIPDLLPDAARAEAFRETFLPPERQSWPPDRVEALQSARLSLNPDPGAQALAAAIRNTTVTSQTVALNGTEKLAAFATLPATGWRLGVVVPKAALLTPVDAVRNTIAAGTNQVTRQFVLFFWLTIALSLCAGLVLHRLAVRPIEELSRAVAGVRWDRLDVPLDQVSRTDEIGRLYRRFSQMMRLVRTSRDEVEHQSKAVRAEKELLSVTLRSIGDGVITTDRSGLVTMMNPVAESLTAWREHEARGHRIEDVLQLFDEAGNPVGTTAVRALLGQGPTPYTNEGRIRALAGNERVVAETAAIIRDGEGVPMGVVLVLRDMTDRARFEEEVSRVQRIESLGVLAAGIAHDFNNLLAAVGGNVSLAEGRIPPGSPVGPYLAAALRGVDRARDLTIQLLTFARGGAPMRKRIAVEAVVREAIGLAARGSRLRVEIAVEDGLWPVAADPGQLARVLQNLTINAAQAMNGAGTLTVHVANVTFAEGERPPLTGGRYVEIVVADDGPGIPAEHLSRVFDPFYTTKSSGSGLGLAVCFSILRKHEGAIAVDSKPGAGATFRLWLPAETGERVPSTPMGDTGPAQGGRILVLDDDDLVRDMLRDLLEALGYDVRTAADGEAAFGMWQDARAAGVPFDTAILDLTVRGGMGGLELAGLMLQVDPDVRAIVMSGYSSDPVLADPKRHGFRAAITKPCDMRTLASTVASVLGRAPEGVGPASGSG